MDVTTQDLLIAYRKTKADMFYSGLPCRAKLLEFEMQLERNIQHIEKLLKTRDEQKLFALCHGYLLAPKKIKFREKHATRNQDSFAASVVYSDPDREFPAERIETCELRLMADVPVAFNVIMTWWILAIGEKLERRLSENSYGNRIRRTKNADVNQYAGGTFKPYMPQYRMWRDRGLSSIRRALEDDKEVVAITADFSSFYHNIDPGFLLNESFLAALGDGTILSEEERAVSALIVAMLRNWALSSPLKRGLPVGCAISAVIANLALSMFDAKIEKEVVPLYYGRYVDDIILVLENTNRFSRAIDVWSWLSRRITGLAVAPELGHGQIQYSDDVLFPDGDGYLSLEPSKTKLFILQPGSGRLLLNSLERQIKEKSSEWRALPDFPENEEQMAASILSACDSAGKEADSLRKIDALSLKRAVFSMKVRNFESYGRSLPPESWRRIRMSFLDLVDKQFTDIKSAFDLYKYFPRIIAVACCCLRVDDVEEIRLVVSIIAKLFRALQSVQEGEIRVVDEIRSEQERHACLFSLNQYFTRIFGECVVSATNNEQVLRSLLDSLRAELGAPEWQWPSLDWATLFAHDLACQPARIAYTHDTAGHSANGVELEAERFSHKLTMLPSDWVSAVQDFNSLYFARFPACYKGTVTGCPDISLVFPVKPLNTFELTGMFFNPFGVDEIKVLSQFLAFERGYGIAEKAFPASRRGKDGQIVTDVAWSKMETTVNLALANWKTDNASYNASVCQVNDPNAANRYHRLMRLVNDVLSSDVKVQYLVFPELSIPRAWFSQIALKLKFAGISLIAGVDYIHKPCRKVRNEVWCSLLNDGGGFPLISVNKFEKARPAIHEAEELRNRAGCTMTSSVLEGNVAPWPIVRHGDVLRRKTFDFSILICSDITDVDYRSQLRGKIDVLFIPSWNQDEGTFASLVESAAYDLHAYIVQCNDRTHAGTRIRVPAKERYNRDVVKIKGGEKDYFVIGRLDIEKLRCFQSFSISPVSGANAVFKPVPSGFVIAEDRWICPQ